MITNPLRTRKTHGLGAAASLAVTAALGAMFLLPLGCAEPAEPASSFDAALHPDLNAALSAVGPAPIAPTPLAAVTCNGAPPSFVDALADFNKPCNGPGNCLTSVTLDPNTYPEAVCNDGTPARMYVKSAPPGSPNADNWIIYLQAGGTCGTSAECRARWCGDQSSLYDASKMSTTGAPANFEGKGIFAARAGNDFADWNLVYVYYCSSDDWLGTNRDTTMISNVGPGALQRTKLSFAGHYIVDAVIDSLRTQAAGNGLPDLDHADRVLFAGSSSGGVGARNHADRIRRLLQGLNPAVDFRLIVDSAVKPNEAYIAGSLDNSLDDAAPEWATVAAFEQAHHDKDAVFHPLLDDSCTAIHLADPKRCADPEHVLYHHLSTPVFVRQALNEKMPNIDEPPGGGITDPLDVDADLWAEATYNLLFALDDLAVTSEEGVTITTAGGGFGPHCDTHTSLDSSRFFDDKVVPPPALAGLSLFLQPINEHDALGNWLDGLPRGLVAQHETATSICAP